MEGWEIIKIVMINWGDECAVGMLSKKRSRQKQIRVVPRIGQITDVPKY